ncbi:MAG: sigma-E factor negative regulatory protein [Dokdonella sp.]
MNQTIHEQLSALMDGELERDEMRFLLKRLETDRDLPPRWARYHVVRQTLRRQELVGLPATFADAVMVRLEAEAVVVRTPRAAWLRWGAGGAIAASVAVAALVLTRPAGDPLAPAVAQLPLRTAQQSTPINVAPASATASVTNDFRAPLLVPNAPIETAPASFGSDFSQPVATDSRLQSYLIRHYQATGGTGQSAFVPYVLLATPQRDPSVAQPVEPVPQNR